MQDRADMPTLDDFAGSRNSFVTIPIAVWTNMSSYSNDDAAKDAELLINTVHDPRCTGMSSFPTLFASARVQAKLRQFYRSQADSEQLKSACEEILRLQGTEIVTESYDVDASIRVREGPDIAFGESVERGQAQRDIERDRLIIDGLYMTGAEVRYVPLCDHIAALVEAHLRDRLPKGRSWGGLSAFATQISENILCKCSRTYSGGASYTALAHHLKEDEYPVPRGA